MKKKIIILVSGFVFLLLVGGGFSVYYLWYIPAQKKAKKELYIKLDYYTDTYYNLLEEGKFINAQELLKEYRNVLHKKKSDKRLLFYFYIMENSLWYMQKDYEKLKANLSAIEMLLKKIDKSKLSAGELLSFQWALVEGTSEFHSLNNEHKKAIDVLENFINENGGVKRIKEKGFMLLHVFYSNIAKNNKKLGRKNIAEIYYNKAFEATDNMRNKHLFALSVAELYDPEKDFDKPMQYLLQAQQNDESQKCYYYLAVLHFRHGNKEEAKKYYSLAIGCKKFPHIDNANLKQLKKMLFD